MGMSCILMHREMDHPQPYTPPEWAYKFPTDSDMPQAHHGVNTNFWWVELGGMGDCIHDTDDLRDELLKIAFGVWDHMKNYGNHGCENWTLDWVGFLPGKRESRRYRGAYVVNQNDVEAGGGYCRLCRMDHGRPLSRRILLSGRSSHHLPSCAYPMGTALPMSVFRKYSKPVLCRAKHQCDPHCSQLLTRHGNLCHPRSGSRNGSSSCSAVRCG